MPVRLLGGCFCFYYYYLFVVMTLFFLKFIIVSSYCSLRATSCNAWLTLHLMKGRRFMNTLVILFQVIFI